jgi:hypothetical protein
MSQNPKRKTFVVDIDNPNTNINFIELNKTKLTTTKITKSRTHLSVKTDIPLPKEIKEISKTKKWVIIAQIGKFKIKRSLDTNNIALFYDDEYVSMIHEDDARKYARLLYHIFDSYHIKSKTIIVDGVKIKVRIERC